MKVSTAAILLLLCSCATTPKLQVRFTPENAPETKGPLFACVKEGAVLECFDMADFFAALEQRRLQQSTP